MITTGNIYQTVKDIIPLMLRGGGNMWMYEGHPHFEISEGRMERIVPTDLPVIYFHGIDITGFDKQAQSHSSKRIQFRIGVKCPESAISEAVTWQRNRLVDMFTPEIGLSIPYTFSVSGHTLNNQSIAVLGFSEVSCSGMQEFRDNDCDCYVSEMAATMTVDFLTNTTR